LSQSQRGPIIGAERFNKRRYLPLFLYLPG
jgi:hypothetical protein